MMMSARAHEVLQAKLRCYAGWLLNMAEDDSAPLRESYELYRPDQRLPRILKDAEAWMTDQWQEYLVEADGGE
jgi:hypothetical protein